MSAQQALLSAVLLRIFDTTQLLPVGWLAGQPGDYLVKDLVVTPFLYVIQLKPLKVSTQALTTRKLVADIKLVAELPQSEEVVIEVHQGFVTIQIPRPSEERGQTVYTSANVPRGSGLRVSLGLDILNQPVYFDFSREMNTNVSFLGVPGSGKSVSLRRSIVALQHNNPPDEVRFLMIEVSKNGIDLRLFDHLPHLIHPVITDPIEAETALNWVALQTRQGRLPFKLFVCIDEVAELINQRPETTKTLLTLVSQGRGVNICNLLATQLTDRDTLGDGKAIFKQIHNVVLGKAGNKQLSYILGHRSNLNANALTGQGDLLLSANDLTTRFAGVFTTRREIERLPRVETVNRLPLSDYTNTPAVAADTSSTTAEPGQSPDRMQRRRGAPAKNIPAEVVAEGLISLERQSGDPDYRQAMQGREYWVLSSTRLKELGRNPAIFKARDQGQIVEIYKAIWRRGFRLCGKSRS